MAKKKKQKARDRNPIAQTLARRTGSFGWKATNKRKAESKSACRGRVDDSASPIVA